MPAAAPAAVDYMAMAHATATAVAPIAQVAMTALQPCIAVVKNIPDYGGVFQTANDWSPMNLASRYAMGHVMRLAQGDLSSILPLMLIAWNLVRKIKDVPWKTLYNKYTMPLAVLTLVGAMASGVWMTTLLLNVVWAIATCRYLMPLHAVLLIRAPNAMLQWFALLGVTRWVWTWNTVFIRSALNLMTATATIALPMAWLYAFGMAWCVAGILLEGCFTGPKRVPTIAFCGLVATHVTNLVYWVGYARYLTYVSVSRFVLCSVALLYTKDACLLQNNANNQAVPQSVVGRMILAGVDNVGIFVGALWDWIDATIHAARDDDDDEEIEFEEYDNDANVLQPEMLDEDDDEEEEEEEEHEQDEIEEVVVVGEPSHLIRRAEEFGMDTKSDLPMQRPLRRSARLANKLNRRE